MLHSEDAIKRPGSYMSQLKGLLQVVVSDKARTCQLRSAEGMLKMSSFLYIADSLRLPFFGFCWVGCFVW